MNCSKPIGWLLIGLFFATIIGVAFWFSGRGLSQIDKAAILAPVVAAWLLLFHWLSKASRFPDK